DLGQQRLVLRAMAVVGADRVAQRLLVLADEALQRAQVGLALGQRRHRAREIGGALHGERILQRAGDLGGRGGDAGQVVLHGGSSGAGGGRRLVDCPLPARRAASGTTPVALVTIVWLAKSVGRRTNVGPPRQTSCASSGSASPSGLRAAALALRISSSS